MTSPIEPVAGGHGERPDVVDDPAVARRDEVGQRKVRPARRLDHLLAERVDDADPAASRVVGVELDVVADRVGRPEADGRRGGEEPLLDDPIEQRQRVRVERSRGRTDRRIGQDLGVTARRAPTWRRTASSRSDRPAVGAAVRRSSGRPGTTGAAAWRPQSTARRCRRASAIGCRAIRSWRAPRSRRTPSYSERTPAANAARRSTSIRAAATPTARDASATWMTGPWYSGSILTAVCVREVVAPPMSSGSSKPWRSISPARWRISSSDGVISPDSPIRSASLSRAVSRIRPAGTITPRSITS